MQYKQERKQMLRDFFVLLVGIALQQMLSLLVNLMDNFMLGAYSETAMSGAALANQVQYILYMIVSGTGAGVTVLGAQYWGKRETEPIRSIISIGMKAALGCGVVFLAVMSAVPGGVMGLLTNEEAVIAEAVEYIHIIRWTYVLYSVSAVLMFSLRSVQSPAVGSVMSGCTIVINVVLNYCLIYGHFGAPEMGIRGAAVATLVSRAVELLIVVVYLLRVDRKLHMKGKDLLRLDTAYLRDYAHAALPVMFSGAMWGLAQAVQTAILGHLSEAAIAANSIASVVFQLFMAFGWTLASASSVIMGKTVGSGAYHLVRPYSRTLQVVSVGMGLLIGGLIFLSRGLVLRVYVLSPETERLTTAFLTVLSVTCIGSCYEYTCESGIIAGGGNPKYAPLADNLFMWLFTIPSAYLSAYVFGAPPAVTFLFLKADQILKCIPNGIYCNSYRWVRNLTRSSAA